MRSNSYEQPTSSGRPLGQNDILYITSYGQPPVLKGHVSCVARVAAHSRFYCTTEYFIYFELILFGLKPLLGAVYIWV